MRSMCVGVAETGLELSAKLTEGLYSDGGIVWHCPIPQIHNKLQKEIKHENAKNT